MKKLLLVLGNGFTIDFINQIKKASSIDVKNLFALGDNVKFPEGNRAGFLSYKNCPALWLLGARPHASTEENLSIIEEIITCSNMFHEYLDFTSKSSERTKLLDIGQQSLYIKAYAELSIYLKFLFCYYNDKITEKEIQQFVRSKKWGWITYLKYVCSSPEYNEVTIVTYNYDIWLERILHALKIQFNISGFDKTNHKVSIIKPHGSISFIPTQTKGKLYQVNYNIKSEEVNINKIKIAYNNLENYEKAFLIPPAADSSRRKDDTWASRLRLTALEKVDNLSSNDEVIICGLSYWHVDRKELDEILIHLDQDVNVTLINPSPSKELNAVLVSLFKNYVTYTSAATLKEYI